MLRRTAPEVGCWYEEAEQGRLFEVVSLDEDESSVAIQYFEGEIEALPHACRIRDTAVGIELGVERFRTNEHDGIQLGRIGSTGSLRIQRPGEDQEKG